MNLNSERIKELEDIAFRIRGKVVLMSLPAGGHISTSLSCTEIMVSLYHGGILQQTKDNFEEKNRNRFILSKGHSETGLYAVLADYGYFPEEWLKTYRQGSCKLGGHADHHVPGVEITSGSLGHGLSFGCGVSIAAKMNGTDNVQYILLGDAECTEGSIWEAAIFASKNSLNNLIAIIDRNHIGSLDFTKNFTDLSNLKEKWESFGWNCIEIDGHSFQSIFDSISFAKKGNKPTVIIAQTIKGKGLSFMENDPIWHVKGLTDPEEVAMAKKELEIE